MQIWTQILPFKPKHFSLHSLQGGQGRWSCVFTDLKTAVLTHWLHDYSCLWTLGFIKLENNVEEALMFRFSMWLEHRVVQVLESHRGGTMKNAEADVIKLLQTSYIQSVQSGSISEKIKGASKRIVPPAL